jgi:hypothetical protein
MSNGGKRRLCFVAVRINIRTYPLLITLAILVQVGAERHTIATEYADTLRRLDAARTEMLQLKNRQVFKSFGRRIDP